MNIFELLIFLTLTVVLKGSRYDKAVSNFSPNGELLQVSYSEEAARQGEAIGAAATEDGDICLCCHSLLNETTGVSSNAIQSKLFKVDDSIWVALCGRMGDGSAVCRDAREYCSKFREQYGTAPQIAVLARYIGDIQHRVTLDGGSRPLAVLALFVGYDDTKDPQIYLVRPSGIQLHPSFFWLMMMTSTGLVSRWSSIAVGRDTEQSIMHRLEEDRMQHCVDGLGAASRLCSAFLSQSNGNPIDVAMSRMKSIDELNQWMSAPSSVE